jgi:DNA-binding XRE family transcriptional regulator
LLIRWIDGSTSLVDLSGLIGRLEGLKPLRDPLIFGKAHAGDFGWAVAWTDDIDIGADTLFRLSVEQKELRMDAAALRHWRAAHELTEQGAANVLGITRRRYRRLESGAKPVPQTVALACSGFDAVSISPGA